MNRKHQSIGLSAGDGHNPNGVIRKKYCFPCSNTSSPIYYKEGRAVKEWEVSSSSAASQGLHEASSICTFYHPCLCLTASQEPSPQGNKTKITAENRPWK